MLTLPAYSEYKDSGLRWLGAIPAHWDLVRTKHLFSERVEKGFPEEQLLAATQTKGVVPKEQYENRTVLAMKDLHLLKLVEEGNYVISLRSFQGGIEYSHVRGIISPAYTVLKASRHAKSDFFRFFFKSRSFVDALTLFVTGIRQGQNIDYHRLSREPLPAPPDEEQLCIGRFLHHFVQKINQLIRGKQDLIELLTEQKQAIIHRAVTRGLDPNVRLKPSGVDWLGDVPQHWEVWQIGHFAKVGNGSTPSRSNSSYWSSDGFPWLNSANVNRGTITDSDQFVTGLALSECHLPLVSPGSILIAITGQGKTRGTAALLRFAATINQHIAYISLRRNFVSSQFLQLALSGAYQSLRTISEDSGSTKGALTCEDVKHFKVALPPIEEQEQIISTVIAETAGVEARLDRTRDAIDLLQEYRTRLIADVVTGKLDTRGVELPELDEVAEVETLDSAYDLEGEDFDLTAALDETEELANADD